MELPQWRLNSELAPTVEKGREEESKICGFLSVLRSSWVSSC